MIIRRHIGHCQNFHNLDVHGVLGSIRPAIQAINFVRPNRNFDFAPGQINVGMMALFLGNRADLIRESQRAAKVRELKFLLQMVLGNRCPSVPQFGQ